MRSFPVRVEGVVVGAERRTYEAFQSGNETVPGGERLIVAVMPHGKAEAVEVNIRRTDVDIYDGLAESLYQPVFVEGEVRASNRGVLKFTASQAGPLQASADPKRARREPIKAAG